MDSTLVKELILIGIMVLAVFEIIIIIMVIKRKKKKELLPEPERKSISESELESPTETDPEPSPEFKSESVSREGPVVKIDPALLGRKEEKKVIKEEKKSKQEINNVYVWTIKKSVWNCTFCGGENEMEYEICHTCGEQKRM